MELRFLVSSDGSQRNLQKPSATRKPAVSWGTGITALAAGLGAAVLGFALLECTKPAWQGLYRIWMTNADYSHGVFVLPFAALIFYGKWNAAKNDSSKVHFSAIAVGVLLILLAGVTTCAGIYCRMLTLEGAAILGYLAGIALCSLGWQAIPIAGPSILFLIFMIPLPRTTGLLMASSLQRIATIVSTYVMQTMGLPAVAEGNVIVLSHTALGIAETCSGIRMLISFFALTTAVCILIDRSLLEKAIVWLSAPLIAIVVNVLRITATGVAYEYGEEHLAELIFHDLAGWLMMPVALLLIWIELQLLEKVFPAELDEHDFLNLPRRPKLTTPLIAGEVQHQH
jgi:exosortase